MSGSNPTTDRGKRGTKRHVLVDQKASHHLLSSHLQIHMIRKLQQTHWIIW